MKQWPQDGSPVEIKDIVEPLVAAFAHCYHCTLKPDAGAFEYRGYDFGIAETAELSARKLLKNPADPLRTILEAGVRLGIEQGRRYLQKYTLLSDFNQEAKAPSSDPGAWPEDEAYFMNLTGPLVKALQHFYKLERVRQSVDVDYQGYDIGEGTKGGSCSPDESLSVKSLGNDGRSADEVIIDYAVMIGMKQGERLLRQDPAYIAQIKQQKAKLKEADKAWKATPREEKLRQLENVEKYLNSLRLN